MNFLILAFDLLTFASNTKRRQTIKVPKKNQKEGISFLFPGILKIVPKKKEILILPF